MKNKIFTQLKEKAFTLAETLIVIGVIGVVAALTLPNLNSSTGDKEKVAKVKKIYASLTDAFDRAQAVYGPFDEWFNDLTFLQHSVAAERAAARITEFMKVSKVCGFESGCFSHSKLIRADGIIDDEIDDYYSDYAKEYYAVTLADGVSVGFFGGNGPTGCSISIIVDIDGPNKGKNQEGSDLFRFTNASANCETVSDSETESTRTVCNWFNEDVLVPDAKFNFNGQIKDYPTAWVVENGNLDYLKCLDELDWDTQTSCK